MIESRSHFCLLRLTLEAESAHGIHCGQGDMTHDVLLVRDGNGLPALPGSSVAGVLRHLYQEVYGAAAHQLFGFVDSTSEIGGQPSWVTVTWGLVHDSQNRPCEELLPDVAKDPLLYSLLEDKPLVRQRVRLSHRGAAVARGKFDTTLMSAGVRYTSLISYWCDGSESSRQLWEQLLTLLQRPTLRLGHGTRSGSGAFKVHTMHLARWNLATAEGRDAYCNRPRSRCSTVGLSALSVNAQETALRVELRLRAEAGWRIGGGERDIAGRPGGDKVPDMLPMHENKVIWHGEKGALGKQMYLVPGSAVKGALRHRVAYHYRCLTGVFAGEAMEVEIDNNTAVKTLFGYAENDEGCAGLVIVSDLMLEPGQEKIMMHNRIDRFTGGVMRGALFGEQVLWQTPLSLRIDFVNPQALARVETEVRQSLQLALQDLVQGWLPLGAGGSRGLGVFVGEEPQWSDGGDWVGAREEEKVS